MSINGIGKQSFYEMEIGQKTNKKDTGNEFYKSLSDTIGKKSESSENADQSVINEPKTEESSDSEKSLDSKWDEALLQFNLFVEDRIKNGPQKFQIGSSEMSLEQWDKMIEKVDVNLDDMKEDLKDRVEEMKKAEAERDLETESLLKAATKSEYESLSDAENKTAPINKN